MWSKLRGAMSSALPQVKAADVRYANILSPCHAVINTPVFPLPGQVHQQQQRPPTHQFVVLKDGWKYPPAAETDCIIQYVNAAFRFD